MVIFSPLKRISGNIPVGGGGQGGPKGGMDEAIRQIVSDAIAPDDVIDIFREAGLQKPDISILSDEFLRLSRKHSIRIFKWSS